METADVVVVGGGCVGTSAAWALARRGAGRVLLLERRELASGATGRSSAILRQHYAFPVTARMARRSLEIFRHFDEVVGGECGYVQTGFAVGVPPEDVEVLRANADMVRAQGGRNELLTPEELGRLVPALAVDDLGLGLYEPESGHADPHATTLAFAAAARRHGAVVRTGTAVRRLRVAAGRVLGVETDAGPVEAGAVVLAAGAWNVGLARAVGVELPVGAYLQEIAVLERPADFPGVRHPVYADFVQRVYFRPEGPTLTLVGSAAHEPEARVDPDSCPDGVRPTTVERFVGASVRRFPALARGRYRKGWAAFYDVSHDAQFILDALPGLAGAWVAVGFSGHGFKHSPLLGELLADLVLGMRSPLTAELDLGFFALSRFAGGAGGHQSAFAYSRPRITR